ncbi:MAG: FtsQ-type POTRA domain-containing protein [Candidatus Berkelbacteria bacterium]|nr:FtsQ-type POTRA domain-containing protein [Candidatus Berkelbacteria bacterium]
MVEGKNNRANRYRLGEGYKKYRNPAIYKAKQKKEGSFHLPHFNFRYIFYLLLIVVCAYFAFFSKYFQIKDIIVEGTNLLSADEIQKEIPLNNNIFFFNVNETEKELMDKHPEIKRVDIYRGIPNALKVVVLERDGQMVWQSGGKSYLISSEGEVTKEIVDQVDPKLPIVIDKKNLPVVAGSTLVSPSFIAFISNIQSGIFPTVNIKPVSFFIDETTFDVSLNTDAGFYVKFNSLRSSKKQLDNLKLVLVDRRPDIHEYVDLRIDGWAYYR